jgi:hypothetical protein
MVKRVYLRENEYHRIMRATCFLRFHQPRIIPPPRGDVKKLEGARANDLT